MYKEAVEPIYITKNGYDDMVIRKLGIPTVVAYLASDMPSPDPNL